MFKCKKQTKSDKTRYQFNTCRWMIGERPRTSCGRKVWEGSHNLFLYCPLFSFLSLFSPFFIFLCHATGTPYNQLMDVLRTPPPHFLSFSPSRLVGLSPTPLSLCRPGPPLPCYFPPSPNLFNYISMIYIIVVFT